MPAPVRLRLEYLEARDVPATFGVPWPDGAHLTLSFAPDGTSISGANSALFAQLGGNTHAWQMEILRAFQTWAVNANLNVGIVPDGGQSFDTAGAPQSDNRFGDIRIGARTMGPDVAAVASPYDAFGPWAGNVVLNANEPFSIGGANNSFDLYSVLLHEAGHVYGLDHNPDTASPLYENYEGVRTGLAASDIANVQALYGARQVDQYDAAGNNSTFAHATVYQNALEADVTTTADVDTYKFTAPLLPQAITIKLQTAGVSLLTAKLSVFDSTGHLIGLASTTDPLSGNLVLPYSSLAPLGTYYVQVQANRSDAFGVGSYRLEVAQGLNALINGVFTTATNLIQLPDPEILLGTNDNRLLATSLAVQPTTTDTAIDFSTRGSIARPSDVDFYRVRAPASFTGGATSAALIVTAWGTNGAQPVPRVIVEDAAGNPLAAEVLIQDNGTASVQVRGVSAGQTYYVRVASAAGVTGGYQLTGDFRVTPVTLPTLSTGTLSATQPEVDTPLDMSQSGACHFVLTTGGTGAAVTVTVRNASGQVVATDTVQAGDTQSFKVVLAAGQYTVSVAASNSSGSSIGLVPFQLAFEEISDPTGIQPSNPNSSSSSPSSGTSGSSGSTYTGPTSGSSSPSM